MTFPHPFIPLCCKSLVTKCAGCAASASGRAKKFKERLKLNNVQAIKINSDTVDKVFLQPGETHEVYAIADSTVTKLADPITRNDDGEVISLSQRFQPQNEDIRY